LRRNVAEKSPKNCFKCTILTYDRESNQRWLWHDVRPADRFRARRTRTDLPDGLIFRNHVKPSREKYFAFSEAQIRRMVAPFRA
jgi:hypothetical protein